MRKLPHFLLLLILLTTVPAAAYDAGGANVLIPIAGRTSGAAGSQWRTDLVITNLEAEPASIAVSFHEAHTSSFTTMTLPGNGTLVLEDVLYRSLQRDGTAGMLRVNSATNGARFVARAYVYNRGSASGEYGQGIPAVAIDALGQEHVLGGITGTGGRRTNIGVANPWPSDVDVLLTMHGAGGEVLAQDARTIGALEVLQINDVFSAMAVAPADGASIRVHSSLGVYPYASIVRNDSGDAIFIAGSGIRVSAPAQTPLCSEPAALLLPYRDETPAEEQVVVLEPGVDPSYVTNVVAPRHGITISQFHHTVPAFTATLTAQQIAALRCEGVVEVIRLDGAIPD